MASVLPSGSPVRRHSATQSGLGQGTGASGSGGHGGGGGGPGRGRGGPLGHYGPKVSLSPPSIGSY